METKDKVQENQNPNAQESDQNDKPEQTREELLDIARKLAEENKQFRQKLAERTKQNENEKRKVLEENGQYKELAEINKQRADFAEEQKEKLKGAFATKLKADAIALEATKMGCVDTDAALHLIDLNAVPINDAFDVDRVHVKTVLDEFKKGKPYLFQKQAPKIPDANPNSKGNGSSGKPLEKMSSQDIESALLSGKYK